MKPLYKMVLILSCGFVSACGTQHVYPGDPREAHELSILSEQIYFFSSTEVLAIDGTSVDFWKDRFAFLPGPHVVEGRISHARFCLEFESVPNGRYELHGNDAGDFLSWLRDEVWWMWIEDEESGVIVATSREKTSEEIMDEHRQPAAACESAGSAS